MIKKDGTIWDAKEAVLAAKESLEKEAEKVKAYNEAIDKFHKREKEQKEWELDNFIKIRYLETSEREKMFIKRAYNFILKKYNTKLKYEDFIKGMMMQGVYDIK